MLDLETAVIDEVVPILREHVPECEVRAFGSRVSGGAHRYSDLDLVVVGKEKLDWRRLEALRDAFAESGLVIMVDVLDWHAIPENLRKVIDARYEIVWRPVAQGCS